MNSRKVTNLEVCWGRMIMGALAADSHSAVNRWKKSFPSSMKYTYMELIATGWLKGLHTVEPLVPQFTAFEVETTIEMLKDVNQQVPIKFRKD